MASPQYDHLKPRYTFERTRRIFGISTSTLKRWIADGLIKAVRLGPRKIEFEQDEVERRYHACRGDEDYRPHRTRSSQIASDRTTSS